MLLSRPAPLPHPHPNLKRSLPSTSSHRPQHQLQQPPPQLPPIQTVSAPLLPPPAPTKEKAKADGKAKLTEQWGPPPLIIVRDHDQLVRGELLGEGGFARVYSATEPTGGKKALKVIAKEQLKSTKNKSKLFGEIKIHQAMQHPNIISFEHCFEDSQNVYMQLELCSHGSLLDLLRRRRRYSEPEARFYLVQLIGACMYMHSNLVIHRDLKLGNLMLDRGMDLRVGDFGLAALVKFPGERKKTICGTPNYIAPEILFDTTNGHSFEVDIWSIGVILYTLLVGKPPFQTKDVKNIYRKIKENSYEFPANLEVSIEAVDLISSILTTKPDQRPTLTQILSHEFFTSGPFPSSIPATALDEIPDFSQISINRSKRNFEELKKACGIVAELERKVGTIREEEEEDEIEDGDGEDEVKETRRVEKEVQKVLQPGSPISELLRSARKPLLVSPHHSDLLQQQPKEVLQRRLVAEVKSTSSSSTTSAAPKVGSSSRGTHKENSGPHPSASTAAAAIASVGGGVLGTKVHRRTLGESRATNTAMSTTTTTTTSQVPREKLGGRVGLGKSSVEGTMRLPARELYDATWRTLDAGLTISTVDQLEALPSPSLAEEARRKKVFIMSWVDYTQKYGTAYSLTDGTSGLYFNDSTTMVLSPDKEHFDYIANRPGTGTLYTRRHYNVVTKDYPEELKRKTYLLQYFEDYMKKTLLRSDLDWGEIDLAKTKNMDFLVKYYRMKNAIVFKLSNDILQFNFYDHSKLCLTQHGSVITFIDCDFRLETFSIFSLFKEAKKLGHYRSTNHLDLDEKSAKRLEKIRLVISKIEYCRDVLKTLASRKSTAVSGGTQ